MNSNTETPEQLRAELKEAHRQIKIQRERIAEIEAKLRELSPESADDLITLEMRFLLSAFEHLADVGESANRVSVCRALDQVARAENMDIFHAGRFLDGAIERGALPRLDSVEWVSIPREMLARLLSD